VKAKPTPIWCNRHPVEAELVGATELLVLCIDHTAGSALHCAGMIRARTELAVGNTP
jgi:hypothetical protein